ncbi:IclR family transcriptional regulator C-terminal domain-containing protein [Actinokineospora sp. NBRC 105648]|uniref:IclR family transcriptional regulator domain-containing protein n=1 Tax=Actinokineospora sp. NBRC 105648 TaxID=3032206 RepID=UPI003331395A
MPDPPAPPEAVAPLVRGIEVLRTLTDAGGTLSPGDLQRATGLARSTVDRVVATLSAMGYLRLDRRDAVLTPRVMELGNAYLAAIGLPRLLGPRVHALADDLDESVSLAVPDGDGVRFIQHATRRRALSVTFGVGDLLPAERTAIGPLTAVDWTAGDWERWRARRAADPRDEGFPAVSAREPSDLDFERRVDLARANGWSLDDQLVEPGLIAVAVPIPSTHAIASVVSHTSRHSEDSARETLLPRLRAAVAGMADDLRGAGPAAESAPVGLAAWTSVSKHELGRDFIESLARGLTVLTAFGEGRAELPLNAVASATGLARATARRALITLEHLGYIESSERLYRPTARVLALGFPALSRATLAQIAHPHLTALSGRVRDSASLAILVGDDVQYTARAATSRIMNVEITIGTRFPAYATAMGRVLLAHRADRAEWLDRAELRPLTPHTLTDRARLAEALDRVLVEDHAVVDEELELGLRSIAVPVRDREGTVVAAVNVAMHSGRGQVGAVLPELRSAAAEIEADLHVAGRFGSVAPG